MSEPLYTERDTWLLADLYEQHLKAIQDEQLSTPERIAQELAHRDDQIRQLQLQVENASEQQRAERVVHEHWRRLVVQEPFDEYLVAHPVANMEEATLVFNAWRHVHDQKVWPLMERIERLEAALRVIAWTVMQDLRPAIVRVASAPHSPFELVAITNKIKARALEALAGPPDDEAGA